MCGGPTRGVAQLPSVITPEALLLGTQGNRWRKHSPDWTQRLQGKSLGMGVPS